MSQVDRRQELKKLRTSLGMTQEQFAREVGVSYSTVSRWETGRGTPSPLARRRIEDLLARVGRTEDSK